MGTWGTGIYSNDVSADVRDMCEEIFPFVSVDEGNRIVFEEFKDIVFAPLVDNDNASFWYALSDWQWKHGILSDEIRSKTLELLRENAGVVEWQESGDAANARKRELILLRLKSQLESPMPLPRVPKGGLAKPKHKVGDVIVFRTCSRIADAENYLWNRSYVGEHYVFRNSIISCGDAFLDPPFEAHDKYMAILCVGVEKTLHSQYLPELYDEHSVYAYYDYLLEDKPTLQTLRECGFLPSLICSLKDFNKNIHDHLGWTYQFSIRGNLFKDRSIVCDIEKVRCPKEVSRFFELLANKNYLSEIDADYYDLNEVFSAFWSSKVRMERLGMTVDNLLNANAVNPDLLTPIEADLAYQEWLKRSRQ